MGNGCWDYQQTSGEIICPLFFYLKPNVWKWASKTFHVMEVNNLTSLVKNVPLSLQ